MINDLTAHSGHFDALADIQFKKLLAKKDIGNTFAKIARNMTASCFLGSGDATASEDVDKIAREEIDFGYSSANFHANIPPSDNPHNAAS